MRPRRQKLRRQRRMKPSRRKRQRQKPKPKRRLKVKKPPQAKTRPSRRKPRKRRKSKAQAVIASPQSEDEASLRLASAPGHTTVERLRRRWNDRTFAPSLQRRQTPSTSPMQRQQW